MDYQVDIYDRVMKRMNLVDFCSLSEVKQEEVTRSCLEKRRFDSLNEVVKALIRKFDRHEIVLVHYKCRYCHGFHLTSTRKRTKKRPIFDMIVKHKMEKGLPIPILDPDRHFRKSVKRFTIQGKVLKRKKD